MCIVSMCRDKFLNQSLDGATDAIVQRMDGDKQLTSRDNNR